MRMVEFPSNGACGWLEGLRDVRMTHSLFAFVALTCIPSPDTYSRTGCFSEWTTKLKLRENFC
jgi:hypothetical protein